MNTTRIYEPDEQDAEFRASAWYGHSGAPIADVPDTEKLKLEGDDDMFSIFIDALSGSVTLDRRYLDGLKHMLNEYEDWLDEH